MAAAFFFAHGTFYKQIVYLSGLLLDPDPAYLVNGKHQLIKGLLFSCHQRIPMISEDYIQSCKPSLAHPTEPPTLVAIRETIVLITVTATALETHLLA